MCVCAYRSARSVALTAGAPRSLCVCLDAHSGDVCALASVCWAVSSLALSPLAAHTFTALDTQGRLLRVLRAHVGGRGGEGEGERREGGEEEEDLVGKACAALGNIAHGWAPDQRGDTPVCVCESVLLYFSPPLRVCCGGLRGLTSTSCGYSRVLLPFCTQRVVILVAVWK